MCFGLQPLIFSPKSILEYFYNKKRIMVYTHMYACLVSFYTRFGAATTKTKWDLRGVWGIQWRVASTSCIKAIITIGKMKNHQHSKSIRQHYRIIWFYNRRNMSSLPLSFLAYCSLTSQYPRLVRLYRPFLFYTITGLNIIFWWIDLWWGNRYLMGGGEEENAEKDEERLNAMKLIKLAVH